MMSPAYIAEVASARYRGRLATVQQIAIISGLFCAFLSNYLLAKAAGASTEALWLGYEAWRWMFWMQAVPSLLFLVLLLSIPESPRYLVVKGRKADALTVLTRLYGPAQAQAKLGEIEGSLSAGPSSAPVRPDQQGHRQSPPDRLDRHRPGHVPAAGRHQRGVLLRRGAVAGGRLLRERCAADQRAVRRAEHRRLPGRACC